MATDSSYHYLNSSGLQLGWFYSGLAIFTFFTGCIAALAVLANDLYFWRQSPFYISPYLFGLAFVLGASHRVIGLMAIIAILPLSAGVGQQFNAYFGTSFMTLPNQGLDLVSGFFLGAIASYLVTAAIHRKTPKLILSEIQFTVPWPLALVIVMVTCSTTIAIARNIYQSAATTSVKGVLFNLVHFRPVDWHTDFMPISDWVAYALAVSMVGIVLAYLINQPNRIQIIFRPLIVGLLAAVTLAVAQAITGIGLPEHLLTFRKDFFGYATIGFQPDLHAFAGYMLLGAIGLIGYLNTLSKPSTERTIVLVTIALCWFGLVLSKSRALLLLAIATVAILVLYSVWKNNKKLFPKILISAIVMLILVSWLIGYYSNSLSGIPVLALLGQLANEFKSRDLTSWSLFSGIFGSRFEIWEAAIRMWWEFPLLGTGQGTFYRYSAIPSFGKSHFLIFNNGENAHNYFLQTLTETGFIGVTVFFLALIFPLIGSSSRRIFFPGLVGLVSLFLGNIFSHSFLVRENLLLASVLVGLTYSLNNASSISMPVNFKDKLKVHEGFKKKLMITSIFAFLLIPIVEAVVSFGKIPFVYGYFCKQRAPIDSDGWTRGAYVLTFPINLTKIQLNVNSIPYIQHYQNVNLELNTYWLKRYSSGHADKLQLGSELYPLISSENMEVTIPILRNQSYGIADDFELEMRTSKCYSPRNMGDSVDSRLLGIKIQSLQAFK